jgi:hypothetical protein
MSVRLGVATIAAIAVTGLSALAVAATPALGAASAAHSYSDNLTSVSCVRADWCMAVGQRYRSAGTNIAERWNGTRWQKLAIPSVRHDRRSDVLTAVSCSSTSRCVAVGYAFSLASGPDVGIAEKWNGSRWQLLHVSIPDSSLLLGISCTRTTCVIVGQNEATMPVVMRLTGSRLVVTDPRVPSGTSSGDLSGVSCTAATSCMAVGTTINKAGDSNALAETWRGGKWRTVPVPHPADLNTVLFSVSCPTATLCLAVGAPEAGIRAGVTLTLVWRGGRWHSLKIGGSPIEGYVPVAVSCASASHCLAAGYSLHNNEPGALSWNGKSLQFLPVPTPSVGELIGTSCTKSARCIAVGGIAAQGPLTYDGALAELWTGTAWRQLAITS